MSKRKVEYGTKYTSKNVSFEGDVPDFMKNFVLNSVQNEEKDELDQYVIERMTYDTEKLLEDETMDDLKIGYEINIEK